MRGRFKEFIRRLATQKCSYEKKDYYTAFTSSSNIFFLLSLSDSKIDCS